MTGLVTLPVSAPTLMDKMVGEVEDVVVEVVGIEEDETETLTLREVRSAISTFNFLYFLIYGLPHEISRSNFMNRGCLKFELNVCNVT